MGSGVKWLARMGVAAALLAGCASRSAPASRTADSAVASGQLAGCPKPHRSSRFREMTWAEYYDDVRERAWRNAATIIWITPPKVRKPRAEPASSTTACAR